ncbi:MAG: hypothetical protein AAF849_07485 [Bacteroidota bacterium]
MKKTAKKKDTPLSIQRWIRSLAFLLGFLAVIWVCKIVVEKTNWNKAQTEQMQADFYDSFAVNVEEDVKDGIHTATGLVYAEGFEVVRASCTTCHSAQLVIQNRATREGWEQMIDWMQATQGLWELGEQEPIILDYLATHYAPEAIGRRANLNVEKIRWYILDLEEEE